MNTADERVKCLIGSGMDTGLQSQQWGSKDSRRTGVQSDDELHRQPCLKIIVKKKSLQGLRYSSGRTFT